MPYFFFFFFFGGGDQPIHICPTYHRLIFVKEQYYLPIFFERLIQIYLLRVEGYICYNYMNKISVMSFEVDDIDSLICIPTR